MLPEFPIEILLEDLSDINNIKRRLDIIPMPDAHMADSCHDGNVDRSHSWKAISFDVIHNGDMIALTYRVHVM